MLSCNFFHVRLREVLVQGLTKENGKRPYRQCYQHLLALVHVGVKVYAVITVVNIQQHAHGDPLLVEAGSPPP